MDAEDVIREYVTTRDEMLDCQVDKVVFSCESCRDHAGCAKRLAWMKAYNAMNAVAQPNRPDVKKLNYDAIIASEG